MNVVAGQLRAMLRPNAGWWGVGAALGLTMLGIAAISTVAPESAALQGQRWLPIALVAMVLCLVPHPRAIGLSAYALLGVSIALLVFVLVPGVPGSIVPVRGGARSWIDLQLMMFQPSEMTKIAFVLALAWYLRYRDSYRTLKGLLVPFLLMFVPVGLILKEPDLGTALLFAPTLFAMLVAAGAKLRHLGMLVGLGVVAVTLNVAVIVVDPPYDQGLSSTRSYAWAHVLAPHQERRIAALIWPQRYTQGAAFQQIVATRLTGAGGVTGLGKARARDWVKYNALPEPHNDMIFAVIVSRWGLVGAVMVLGLYLLLFLSFIMAAARSKDPFARLACVGFAGMLLTQAAINIGVNVGLVPTTGITLPFISYGGSSLVATFAMVGLMVNFASRRATLLTRPSFEFDHADAIFQ